MLSETDRLFACDFCRVKSFLIPRGVFRYVLPHTSPTEEPLLFFPYWRFKGMMFFCTADGVRHRFLDISHPAIDAPVFPQSVGLRSQALKLRFLTPELAGRFLHPSISLKQVIGRLDDRFGPTASTEVFHRSHVGETWSLIYAPFYVRRRLYDAVLDRPVSAPLEEASDPLTLAAGPAEGHLQFIAAVCPYCGADLDGERDSLALACRNCDSLWTGNNGKLRRLPFGYLEAGHPAARYLPFWRITADVSGIDLRSYADLVRAANLPKVVRPSMDSEKFHFWALAFKLRPEAFLRLSSRATLAQPGGTPLAPLPPGPMQAVNLAPAEALETLKVTLADVVRPRRVMLPRLAEIAIKPRGLRLVYLPFAETRHDYIHPGLGLAVNKAMLRTAGNL